MGDGIPLPYYNPTPPGPHEPPPPYSPPGQYPAPLGFGQVNQPYMSPEAAQFAGYPPGSFFGPPPAQNLPGAAQPPPYAAAQSAYQPNTSFAFNNQEYGHPGGVNQQYPPPGLFNQPFPSQGFSNPAANPPFSPTGVVSPPYNAPPVAAGFNQPTNPHYGPPQAGSLYPSLSPMGDDVAGPLPPKGDPYGGPPSAPYAVMPQRPAPPPPSHIPGGDVGLSTHLFNPTTSPWQDTPLPLGLKEVWRGEITNVYFVQHNGRVVGTHPGVMVVHLNEEFDWASSDSRRRSVGSATSSRGSSPMSSPTNQCDHFSVLVECPGVCRVKLSPHRGCAFLSKAQLALVDTSTNPSRTVIIGLSAGVEVQQLQDLLSSNASLSLEDNGLVTTVSSTVETAFNYTSKLGSDLINKTAPGIFKTTKGLRKGTGALVRFGGSLVNKGASLVGDVVSPAAKEDKLKEFDPRLHQIRSSLTILNESLAQSDVTIVSPHRGL